MITVTFRIIFWYQQTCTKTNKLCYIFRKFLLFSMELHAVVGVPPNITAADLTAHFRPHHQLDKLEPARKDPERQRGRRRRVRLSCLGLSRTKQPWSRFINRGKEREEGSFQRCPRHQLTPFSFLFFASLTYTRGIQLTPFISVAAAPGRKAPGRCATNGKSPATPPCPPCTSCSSWRFFLPCSPRK